MVLDDATGKNNGEVQGRRYFDCQPGHGMFVRPAVTTIVDQPTPKPTGRIQAKANGVLAKGRQSVAPAGLRRQSIVDSAVAKRQSVNAGSPTPRAKGAGIARSFRVRQDRVFHGILDTNSDKPDSKSPTKQVSTAVSSSKSTPQSTTSSASPKPASAISRGARTSIRPPSGINARVSRQSIAGALNSSARPTSVTSASSRGSTYRPSLRPDTTQKLSSISGGSQASGGSADDSSADNVEYKTDSPSMLETQAKPFTEVSEAIISQGSLTSQNEAATKTFTLRDKSPLSRSQRLPAGNSVLQREVDDLKTKLRLMEKKRMEDREKFRALDRIQTERDKLEAIIQKLQSKYQPQQQEIADLRRQLKEEEMRAESLEKQQAENDSVVEMAALDREMAEETAESLKIELDALRQNHEELTLEVEVLREENQELGKEMSPEEKTSQGWLQMERSNERLREALVRLRDVTQDQEADLKGQIADLEKDLINMNGLKEQHNQTKEALGLSESTIEELRQQLDTALGAEDMIEELTEKNLTLNEQVENLKAAVNELESLKELHDELEINHTENAKQMQNEIEYNEMLLNEQAKESATKEQTIKDLEYTVVRFRELVTSMQTDLEEMRVSQQLTEAEANDLTSRSRAMMDLNLRLQASASKAQVTAIETELRKLEAQESAEHLSIVQLFLPESFKRERDSVGALLRFRRIGFKANLINGFIKEKASSKPLPGRDENVIVSCDMMEKLTQVTSICDRFIKFTKTCNLEEFAKLEGALFDLEPVERALNRWIEVQKRADSLEDSCVDELSRSIALLTHLAETHVGDDLEHFADDLCSRALIMQSQLESAATTMSYLNLTVEAKAANSNDGSEEDDTAQNLHRKVGTLISQSRNAKVTISKTIRQLDELQLRSLTLNKSALGVVEQSQDSTADLSRSFRSFAAHIVQVLNSDDFSSIAYHRELHTAMTTSESSLSSLFDKLHTTNTNLQAFNNLTSSLAQTVEFSPLRSQPPWRLLAEKLQAQSAASASRDIEIVRLKDEAVEHSTALALRDKSLEELSVKVEVLEKRAAESGGRRERVRELEAIGQAAKQRELELIGTINRLRSERNDLRAERDTWKKPGATQVTAPADATAPRHTISDEATHSRIGALEAEIEALQAAVRHLRSASYACTLSSAYDFLQRPLTVQPSIEEKRERLRQSEAKSVISELLRLATDPANGAFKLKERKKEERLSWRPAKESAKWQIGRRREEWEEWREWRDSLARDRIVPRYRLKGEEKEAGALLRSNFRPFDLEKDKGTEVRIIGPEQWEEIDREGEIA